MNIAILAIAAAILILQCYMLIGVAKLRDDQRIILSYIDWVIRKRREGHIP